MKNLESLPEYTGMEIGKTELSQSRNQDGNTSISKSA